MKKYFSILLFSLLFQSDIISHSLPSNSFVVKEAETMQILVPERPLGSGSLQIEPINDQKKYSQWEPENHLEAYRLIQKIAQVWGKQGISDYMVYAREDSNQPASFHWEIIPFPQTTSTKNRLFKQIKILWNTTYGPTRLSDSKRSRQANEFRTELDFLTHNLIEENDLPSKHIGHDLFCSPSIIDAQRVYEGKTVNLLYDYAPLTKLHFLIVTKKHHEKFAELSEEEYLEAALLTQKLMLYYQQKGYRFTNLFVKTGKEAGQSQPHWHQHLIFTSSRKEELSGVLIILKNLFFGHSPLSKEMLNERISTLKAELNENLNFQQ
jgi:diadenosine tetraphosphate (Ap4A) HIT family hydrolase